MTGVELATSAEAKALGGQPRPCVILRAIGASSGRYHGRQQHVGNGDSPKVRTKPPEGKTIGRRDIVKIVGSKHAGCARHILRNHRWHAGDVLFNMVGEQMRIGVVAPGRSRNNGQRLAFVKGLLRFPDAGECNRAGNNACLSRLYSFPHPIKAQRRHAPLQIPFRINLPFQRGGEGVDLGEFVEPSIGPAAIDQNPVHDVAMVRRHPQSALVFRGVPSRWAAIHSAWRHRGSGPLGILRCQPDTVDYPAPCSPPGGDRVGPLEVVGSIILRISVIFVAGKPLISACRLITEVSFARYTQKVLLSAT